MSLSPSLTTRRALGLSAAVALCCALAAPAGALASTHRSPHKKHTAPAKRTKPNGSVARRNETSSLIARWSGIPAAGQLPGSAYTETYAFGGAGWGIHHTVTYANGVLWDGNSVWADLIDVGTTGPSTGSIASAWEADEQGDLYCAKGAAAESQFDSDRRYVKGLTAAFSRIEQVGRSAAARATLPAGPALNGRQTVVLTIATWPTFDRSGAKVTLDATNGDVLRIAPVDPTWASHTVDITRWQVALAPSAAALAAAGPVQGENPAYTGDYYPGRCI